MRVRLDVAEPLLSHEVETERRLDGMIETAQRGIESMLQRGYRRWYLMTMAARSEILRRVQTTEQTTGMRIISETELAHIRAHWASGEYGDDYRI